VATSRPLKKFVQIAVKFVEGSTKSYLGKDRQIGVSRIEKRSVPPVQKKGRE
jgi:hypothetical protein